MSKWFALCLDPGAAHACNTCSRNPENQDPSLVKEWARWSTPLKSSDGRCRDFLQETKGRAGG